MASLLRTFNFPAGVQALTAMILLLLLAAPPSVAASEDTQRDFRGFNEQIKRREMARRALVKGRTYLEDNSFGLARESMIEALRLHENLHEARFYLGVTEYRDGNFKLAVAQLENLYKRQPSYPMLSLELARGYLALRECSVARRWLQRHLERGKKSKESDKLKKKIKNCAKDREKQH